MFDCVYGKLVHFRRYTGKSPPVVAPQWIPGQAASRCTNATGPDRVGAQRRAANVLYLIEVLIEVKLVLMVPPSRLIIAIIASAIPAAIRPYSIAVAPDSSAQNLEKRFNYTSRCRTDLVVPRGI
jgi:hypothetical protein